MEDVVVVVELRLCDDVAAEEPRTLVGLTHSAYIDKLIDAKR